MPLQSAIRTPQSEIPPMPLTFIDIERQKNWRIWLFFLFLLALYLVIAAAFAAAALPCPDGIMPCGSGSLRGVTALLVAGIHFWFSAYDTVTTVMRSLDAQPPDPKDDIHTMLVNVMQEIHVVTGNRRTIQCFVIPSLSMNALAVADLKGNAAIGITEGLLSRLTRPQLETVVAHEAHHILSGDCLETTVAASLFGTYSSALEKLSDTSRGPVICCSGVLPGLAPAAAELSAEHVHFTRAGIPGRCSSGPHVPEPHRPCRDPAPPLAELARRRLHRQRL